MKQSAIEAKSTRPDRQIVAIQALVATARKIAARNDRQIAELTKNVKRLVKTRERGQNGDRISGSPSVH
jgi:hypothetical protein